jgi:hypothetical protein
MLLARAAAARRRWGQCTPTWQQTAERGEKLLNRRLQRSFNGYARRL